MKTSDIKDADILNFLADRQGSWTSLWYGHFGKESDIQDVYWAFPEGTPDKICHAKMKSLYKRGLVGGCDCGCRGDFEITDKGLQLIGRTRTKEYTGY